MAKGRLKENIIECWCCSEKIYMTIDQWDEKEYEDQWGNYMFFCNNCCTDSWLRRTNSKYCNICKKIYHEKFFSKRLCIGCAIKNPYYASKTILATFYGKHIKKGEYLFLSDEVHDFVKCNPENIYEIVIDHIVYINDIHFEINEKGIRWFGKNDIFVFHDVILYTAEIN